MARAMMAGPSADRRRWPWAVCLILLAHALALHAREPAAPFSFRVLSYNVQARPILDDSAPAMRAISPLLNAYDIVGVQESFANKALLMAAANHETKVHFTQRRSALALTHSGLSLLARFPSLGDEARHYSANAGLQNAVASKGVLLVRALINGVAVDVYDTHMEAGGSRAENRSRKVQATELIAFVATHSSRETPVILLGDFNMSPAYDGATFDPAAPGHFENDEDMRLRTHTFERVIDQLGMSDAHDALSAERPADIDRILFRSGCHAALVPLAFDKEGARFVDDSGVALSDTTPITATFALVAQEGPCEAGPLIGPEPAPRDAWLYEHCGEQGARLFVHAGEGKDLSDGLVFDRAVSGVRVGRDAVLILTRGADGADGSLCLTSDVPCFSSDDAHAGWNDSATGALVLARDNPAVLALCGAAL